MLSSKHWTITTSRDFLQQSALELYQIFVSTSLVSPFDEDRPKRAAPYVAYALMPITYVEFGRSLSLLVCFFSFFS